MGACQRGLSSPHDHSLPQESLVSFRGMKDKTTKIKMDTLTVGGRLTSSLLEQ